MQMYKKAQLGEGLYINLTIIAIFVILAFFAIASIFVRENVEVKSGVESVEILEIESYKERFIRTIEDVSPPYERAGEIYNKHLGRYVCNVEGGWTNKDNPWKTFDPPCILEEDSAKRFAIDDSIDLSKNNPSDKGACIGYYYLKYVYILLNNEPSSQILDLLNYDFLNGYVNKVDDLFMNQRIREDDSFYKIINRSQCYTYASVFKTRNYVIFYDSFVDNLNEGFDDDFGYCVGFSDSRELNPFTKMTREECKAIDSVNPAYDYSFFVSLKGDQHPVKEQIIFETFTDTFDMETEKQEITKEEVKEKCDKYAEYDLIFLRGIKDLIEEASEDEIEGIYRRRARAACSRYWQTERDKARQENDLSLEGIYDFDYEIIDKNGGILCCYGKKR